MTFFVCSMKADTSEARKFSDCSLFMPMTNGEPFLAPIISLA